MNDSVKVSVVIPNYNHQSFLETRIVSILNQTYQNYELIILDDASIDDSKEIISRYANHPKVSCIIYNKENSGSVFKQWIKGIELAKGDYIWIAESDDYADSLFLEHTTNLLINNDSIGMVFTDTHKVDLEGRSLGLVSKSKPILNDLADKGGVINHMNFSDYLLNKMVIVNASSVLFRKSALLQLDFDTLRIFKNIGDVFVYIGIVLQHDIQYLPSPLNYMRLHADSTTKKHKKSGHIYKDKLLMIHFYMEQFWDVKLQRKKLISFVYDQLFFSIDYGHSLLLKRVMKKLLHSGFMEKKHYLFTKSMIFLYSSLTHQGKPHLIREKLKSFLFKSIR